MWQDATLSRTLPSEEPAPMGEHAAPSSRFLRPTPRLVGLYQSMLRQQLAHFFPDGNLEVEGDRGSIQWTYLQDVPNYRLSDLPDGLGLAVEWLGTRYGFQSSHPLPFRASEKRLVETIIRFLDQRFQALMELASGDTPDIFAYAMEDMIVTEFLSTPQATRVPAALESLRVAALTTYEDRRVSSGALLLGTAQDPAYPDRDLPTSAPRYHVGMSAIKSLHRICDGLNTVFVVDREGHLAWAVDVQEWVHRAGMSAEQLPAPCPRRFEAHARATIGGSHVCLVLTPSQEIKIFTRGALAFTFGNARWRLLDIPGKYADWCNAVGKTASPGLARRLFQSALNLADSRTGALLVVLRDPEIGLPQIVAPGDRIRSSDEASDVEPLDDTHLNPRLTKRVLHHLVAGQDVFDLDGAMLEALAGVDGALVTDPNGHLHAFGAILRISSEAVHAARAADGARSVAALAASFHGPVLKVSQDGVITMYLGGRHVWDL